MLSAHSVIHILFTSALSSYVVYYQYPPLWCPFISPHLFIPSLPHFTHWLSPVPTPPKSSLPHPSALSSLSSSLFVFLIHSPLGCLAPLSSWVERKRSEQHCRRCGRRLMTRGYEQARNPSRVEDEREDDIPIKRYARTQMEKSMHAPTCTKSDKPRQRHAHRRDTAIFNVPVWLMSPESPCLGCKSLDFCSSLFCLVVIWEQMRTHTHLLTLPHKPLQLLWWKSHRQVWKSEGSGWIRSCIVQTLTCICFVRTCYVDNDCCILTVNIRYVDTWHSS